MAHIDDIVYAGHLLHVGLVVHKVGVGLDGGCDGGKVMPLLDFHIDHAAMDAGAGGDGHGEGGLDTGHSLDSNGVAHRHAGTEVGVGNALGRQSLQQGAHNAVAARIPTGGNDADGTGSTGGGIKGAAQGGNLGVDVEAVDRMDAQCQNFLGILLHTAGGGTQQSHINVTQFADVAHNGIAGQFCRAVGCALTAHDACHLKVGRLLQSLEGIMSDIAVTHYGGSNLLHKYNINGV